VARSMLELHAADGRLLGFGDTAIKLVDSAA
jgi:hypothetical protein